MSSAIPAIRSRNWLVFALIALVAGTELYIAWLALHPQVSDDYRAYYIEQSTTCLGHEVSGRYQLGSTVSFMPDNRDYALLLRVCGWDGPAGDGTHSVGTSSRLRFAVAEPDGDLILRLEITAIAVPDHPQQRVLVSSNGIALGEADLPAGETHRVDFDIPASAVDRQKGHLDLTLSYPDAAEVTPNESDTHYRAIKLMSVQLRHPDDRPSSGAADDPRALRYRTGPD